MIDLEAYEELDFQTDGRRPRRVKLHHKPKQKKWEVVTALYEHDGAGKNERLFSPTVNATSEEMGWIVEHLSQFYHGKVIADVTRRVKGGKEANVYCCAAHPDTGRDLIAAKLYRPRKFRSLKNTTQYEQGRPMLDAKGNAISARDWRMHKAIAGKSRKGLEAAQTSWLMHEFTLMQQLHQAGADVPEPLKHNEYALLMEYVGDETMPAPLLIDVTLDSAEARPLFERLMWNVEIMLSCGWVHGDLSAYNVLYWQGEIAIIDFPQVVGLQTNPSARAIFRRDVERVCGYFARYGVASNPPKLVNDLWRKHLSQKETTL
jgi:RIO kinase 1